MDPGAGLFSQRQVPGEGDGLGGHGNPGQAEAGAEGFLEGGGGGVEDVGDSPKGREQQRRISGNFSISMR